MKTEIEIYPTFNDFWLCYDKKVGDKEKLVKKWNKLSQNDKEAIIEYLPLYKEATPDKQYRKNPETFLNNKSWNDEIIIKTGIQTNKPKSIFEQMTESYGR